MLLQLLRARILCDKCLSSRLGPTSLICEDSIHPLKTGQSRPCGAASAAAIAGPLPGVSHVTAATERGTGSQERVPDANSRPAGRATRRKPLYSRTRVAPAPSLFSVRRAVGPAPSRARPALPRGHFPALDRVRGPARKRQRRCLSLTDGAGASSRRQGSCASGALLTCDHGQMGGSPLGPLTVLHHDATSRRLTGSLITPTLFRDPARDPHQAQSYLKNVISVRRISFFTGFRSNEGQR